jgi:ATP-binding cassette subfamily B multidrug efflux pump
MGSSLAILQFMLLHRFPRRLLIIFLGALSVVVSILSPMFQQLLVDRWLGHSAVGAVTQQLDLHLTFTEFQLLLFAVTAFLVGGFLLVAASQIALHEGVLAQQELANKLYRSVLSSRPHRRNQRTVGEIVSNYATDVQSATAILDQSLPAIVGIVLPLIAGPYVVCTYFGVPVLPLLCGLTVVLILNLVLAARQTKLFQSFKSLAAERIGVVNEWIQHMKALKVLGWIEYFEGQIVQKRQTETHNRIRMVTNGQTLASFGSSFSFVLALLALWSLLDQGDSLTPGRLLAIFWVIGIFMSRPIRQFPWFITFGMDAWTSIGRLAQVFTDLEDPIEKIKASVDPSGSMQGLAVRGLNLSLSGKKILSNIEFDLKRGELVAIVGDVGSGKSQLLLSLLGETPAAFEEYTIEGHDVLTTSRPTWSQRFGYVAEDAFIISSSVRNNVIFDYDCTPDFDNEVLQSLERARLTLDELGGGDEALEVEIGERGVNLSGGQKQRLALARSSFIDREVILLDDALSAVDVKTESEILEKLIVGDWAKRTRVVVTHRFELLKKVDRIMFMEAGRLVAFADFDTVFAQSQAFRDFVLAPKPAADATVEARS